VEQEAIYLLLNDDWKREQQSWISPMTTSNHGADIGSPSTGIRNLELNTDNGKRKYESIGEIVGQERVERALKRLRKPIGRQETNGGTPTKARTTSSLMTSMDGCLTTSYFDSWTDTLWTSQQKEALDALWEDGFLSQATNEQKNGTQI